MSATDEPTIEIDPLEDGIRVLRLNRPALRNALTDCMVDAFAQAIDRLSSDDACRVIVVTGAGKGFCAGFDLSLAQSAPGQAEGGEVSAWTARQERYAQIVTRLRAARQPVIAAVNGAASGAGFGLALAADVRIAARSARFNAAFVRIGLSSCDIGVSWLLPRCVGTTRAFEIMLTGRFVDADEAERIGLVSSVVEDDALLARALDTARMIAANSAFGVWMTKRGMWANLETPSLQAAIELENRTQILARGTGDMAAAVRDFMAGRQR